MTGLELVTEVADGSFQIASAFGQRRLHQQLLLGEDGAVLVDAGNAATPEGAIAPALEAVGTTFDALRWLVITHPDVDHQGGAAGVLARAPHCRAACGYADVPMVSDPEVMVADRYRAYAIEHALDLDPAEVPDVVAQCGAPIGVELALAGGERLPLAGRELEVHHLPGHSAGHLGVLDQATGDLFSGDAVHGRGSPAADGGLALPPTYEDVDAYLATIEHVRALRPARMASGHLPVLEGGAIAAFLDESARFVAELDALLLDRLAAPATLRELCGAADETFGPFPARPAMFRFTVLGHVRRLVRRGQVELVLPLDLPRRYRTA